jgi:hypothetical protein
MNYNTIEHKILYYSTCEDDFVSRAAGEWRNLSVRVTAIIRK